MSEREFDVVVVGAGPAGEVAAGRLGDAGLDVAVVEPELIGGECSYWACMPSKAMLRPARRTRDCGGCRAWREAVTGRSTPAAVLARRDQVVHDFDDSGQVEWLDDKGMTLVRAHGRLDGERRVQRRRRRAGGAQGGDRGHRQRRELSRRSKGWREARPWGNREATAAQGGAGAAGHPGRRRRGRRDGRRPGARSELAGDR